MLPMPRVDPMTKALRYVPPGLLIFMGISAKRCTAISPDRERREQTKLPSAFQGQKGVSSAYSDFGSYKSESTVHLILLPLHGKLTIEITASSRHFRTSITCSSSGGGGGRGNGRNSPRRAGTCQSTSNDFIHTFKGIDPKFNSYSSQG